MIEAIKNQLSAPLDRKWITAYFEFSLSSTIKTAHLRKINSFIKEISWKVFINKKLVKKLYKKDLKKTSVIHIAPTYNSILSPKTLIRKGMHYKLVQFSKQLNTFLELKRPTYKTELSIKDRKKVYVIHNHGMLYIMYNIKDRILFEKDPDFFRLSNKMFVETLADIKKHIKL